MCSWKQAGFIMVLGLHYSWGKILYFFIFGCALSLLLHRLSLVAVSRGSSLVVVHRLLTAVASLVAEHGL